MSEVAIEVRRLPHAAGLPLPSYATSGAAGADVVAAVERDMVVASGARVAVPTGLELAVPQGYEVQVRPRSGLALHHGITLANAPGTVDSDYRGELMVILVNLGREPFVVRRGDRIAQLVISQVFRATIEEADRLPATSRGARGFGSTGV
jgi:dUTP diphosphatase